MLQRNIFILISFLAVTASTQAQQETELKSQGLVLPRTNSGTPEEGMVRYNPILKTFEGYDGSTWITFGEKQRQKQLILSTADFESQNNGDDFTRTRNELYYSSGVSKPAFIASFNIPAGATIDSIRMVVRDNSTLDVSLIMRRYFTQPSSIDLEDVNDALLSDGSSVQFRAFEKADFSGVAGTGLQDFFFTLQLTAVDDQGARQDWPGSDLALHKVIIDYTTP